MVTLYDENCTLGAIYIAKPLNFECFVLLEFSF
jgi:hypothetical protein